MTADTCWKLMADTTEPQGSRLITVMHFPLLFPQDGTSQKSRL